jgi:hypothetical protein
VLDLRYNCAGSTVWNVFGKNYGLACGMGGKAVNALFGLWPIRLGSIVFVERDRDRRTERWLGGIWNT